MISRLIFLFAAVAVIGCSVLEGPTGPEGPQGEQGSQGPAGKDGETVGTTLVWVGQLSPGDHNGSAWVINPDGYMADSNDLVLLYTGADIGDGDYLWNIRTDYVYGRAAVMIPDGDMGMLGGSYKLVLIKHE